MENRKQKLTIREQVEYMERKGVQFNIVSKEEAEQYLKDNTYFFKIKAYAKNYEKYRNGKKTGQYLNLEFAYLQELSVIDFHIRKMVMSICVNIEHMIKTMINRIISEIPEEDGYQIVQDFQSDFLDVTKKIGCLNSHYTGDLKGKLNGFYASWNIVELLTFNDLEKFYGFCVKRWRIKLKEYAELSEEDGEYIKQLMFVVRHLRNAAAHNNCLINNLKKQGGFTINKYLAAEIDRFFRLSALQKTNKLRCCFLHDFTAMIVLFKKINRSEGVLNHTKEDLEKLMGRINEHKSYFARNNIISSSFAYLQKVVDNL